MKAARKGARGFSLVELLVSMLLLLILGVLIVQVTTAVQQAIRISGQKSNPAEQARIIFDRIGADLSSAILRPDADFISGTSGTDNNLFQFLATVYTSGAAGASGTTDNRPLSNIAWRLFRTGPNDEYPNTVCLLRGARHIGWDDTGFMGLDTGGGPGISGTTLNLSAEGLAGLPVSLAAATGTFALTPPVSGTLNDFDVVAPHVIQCVIGYQIYPDLPLVNGAASVTLQNTQQVTPASGTNMVYYSPPMRPPAAGKQPAYVDPSRIGALVVGLVILDSDKAPLLDANVTSALYQAFSATPMTAGELPVTKWNRDFQANVLNNAAIPLPVRQGLRFYQRFYPLNPYGEQAPWQ